MWPEEEDEEIEDERDDDVDDVFGHNCDNPPMETQVGILNEII